MDKSTQKPLLSAATISDIVSGMDDKSSDILVLHYKSGMSNDQISKIFSIEESEVSKTISTFAAMFSNEDYLMNVVNCIVKMKKQKQNGISSAVSDELMSRDKEIADLKRRLKEAEIKAEVYQEMVRVAEDVFKIPIRKKFGAK